jgi:AAA domain, putative AbiEii toxin, Type IV TA system
LLQPRSRDSRTGALYELVSEGRGVLEVITLLTYTLSSRFDVLLIDEPELGIHPQQQKRLLAELRRSGKRVIIATHSPFMLGVRSGDDLCGVVCFHADGRAPSQALGTPRNDWDRLLAQLTEDRSAFFFSEAPVFCEGFSDSVLLSELYQSLERGLPPAGAPIAMDGFQTVLTMLRFAHALGKSASAILDQDTVLDPSVGETADAQPDYAEALKTENATSEVLRNNLIACIDALQTKLDQNHSGLRLTQISSFKDPHPRRVTLLKAVTNAHAELSANDLQAEVAAVMTAFERYRALLVHARIHVLPRGSLECHLPGHGGNKREVLAAELAWLRAPNVPGTSKPALTRARYAELVAVIEALPASPIVDLEGQLRAVLAEILNTLLPALFEGRWTSRSTAEEQDTLFRSTRLRRAFRQLCTVQELQIQDTQTFSGKLVVHLAGGARWQLNFDQHTNTANRASLVLMRDSGGET